MAGAARKIAGVEEASTDPDRRAVLLRGTEAQLKVAEWLLVGLESLASEPEEVSQVRQYAVPGGGEVVRLFHLRFATSDQASQELGMLVLHVLAMPKAYLYSPPHALAVCGTVEQVRMTAWVIGDLDQPLDRRPLAQQDRFSTVHQYQGPNPDEILRIFYLPRGTSAQSLQEAVGALLVIAVLRYVNLYNESCALVVRGKPHQVSLAEWVLHESESLDSDHPELNMEYSIPTHEPDHAHDRGDENTVRLYRLPHEPTDSEIEEFTRPVRAAGITKRFVLRTRRVVVVRGTPEPREAADKVLARR